MDDVCAECLHSYLTLMHIAPGTIRLSSISVDNLRELLHYESVRFVNGNVLELAQLQVGENMKRFMRRCRRNRFQNECVMNRWMVTNLGPLFQSPVEAGSERRLSCSYLVGPLNAEKLMMVSGETDISIDSLSGMIC